MNNKIIIMLLIFFPFITGYTFKDTNISVTVGDIDTPVYNVEVSWDAMEFTYNEMVNYIWDNTTHTYELTTSTYKWSSTNNIVKINNKSYVPVNIELKYLGTEENIKGTFDISKTTIKANESINSKLTLEGKLSSNNTDYSKIGIINMMIF